jgi:hypothetical protein
MKDSCSAANGPLARSHHEEASGGIVLLARGCWHALRTPPSVTFRTSADGNSILPPQKCVQAGTVGARNRASLRQGVQKPGAPVPALIARQGARPDPSARLFRSAGAR